MNKHMAIVRVDKEILCQLLSFPEGTEIHRVQSDTDLYRWGTVEMQVSHPDLPEVRPEEVLSVVNPQYRREEQKTVFVSWWSE